MIVVTILSDGTKVEAQPQYDAESTARARSLGYEGNDQQVVWAMTLDHDPMHQRLARCAGLANSPTLWAVGHDEHVPPELVDFEERLVLRLQRLQNEGIDILGLMEMP